MKGLSVRRMLRVLLVLIAASGSQHAVAQTPGGDSGSGLPGSSSSLLGPSPGAGGGVFAGNSPGTGQLLGGRPGVSTPKGITPSITTPGTFSPTLLQQPIAPPPEQPIAPSSTPLFGMLEVPADPEDDGPASGVTLDKAIDLTLQRSLDLRSKYFEIPQA